jgi:hypothetical protein
LLLVVVLAVAVTVVLVSRVILGPPIGPVGTLRVGMARATGRVHVASITRLGRRRVDPDVSTIRVVGVVVAGITITIAVTIAVTIAIAVAISIAILVWPTTLSKMTIPAANVALLLVVIVIVVASVVRSVVWSVVVVVISTLLLLRGVAHRGVHFVVLGGWKVVSSE